AIWDLVLWRIVGGLGIGIASVVAPAYIAEISPKLIRGRLASLQQLAITLGIFAALLSDAVFANAAGNASAPFWFGWEAWRWMFLAGAVPAVVYGVLALRLPESPRYLMQKGR
ncbi:MFS transporter, partial [Escherichia coli]|nr:MFS transporter [Escherichia coli]